MAVQIRRLPPTHYDHQRHHMRAEELRHHVRPQSAPGTKHAVKHLDMELENLKRVFTALDVRKDGVVTSEEIFMITRKLRSKLSLSEVSELVWEIDDSLEGRLTWANFASSYYRCRRNASGVEPRGLLYLVDFLLMDKNFSGEASVDEVMQVLYERHGKHSLERLTRHFFKVSSDAEVDLLHARVTFDEFYHRFARPRPKATSQPDRRKSYSKDAQAKLHAAGSWAPRRGLTQRSTSNAWARAIAPSDGLGPGSIAARSVAGRSTAIQRQQACSQQAYRGTASAPSLGAQQPSAHGAATEKHPSLAWWDNEPGVSPHASRPHASRPPPAAEPEPDETSTLDLRVKRMLSEREAEERAKTVERVALKTMLTTRERGSPEVLGLPNQANRVRMPGLMVGSWQD